MLAQNGHVDVRVAPHIDAITQWRRDIHQHPELGFDVHRTASLVAEKLRSFGVDNVVEGVGRTGVVGVINGNSIHSGTTIGLRADMDALPIVEQTELDYQSNTTGKMHACGHDGHTAMLLGAAKVLCETRAFNGSAVVIFQPAEESGAGGRIMVEDGLIQRFDIQQVYGMHNLPNMPLGRFGMRSGPIMAAVDTFDVSLTGKGGHAAMPHLCIDTMVVAANVISALQHIASRQADSLDSVVVSVTSIKSDNDSYNVIPHTVKLKGTVRALTQEVKEKTEQQVKDLINHTAKTYGASADIQYWHGYPATVNSDNEARIAAEVARSVVGSTNVDANVPPVMGAEDFSYMLNECRGAFVFIGNGESAGLHHPKYNFNDHAIGYGCSYWLALVEHLMPAN